MILNDFIFSYKNILLNRLKKKKYFSFLRKIVGIFFKFLIREIKYIFFKDYQNLDLKNHINQRYYSFTLNEIFKEFNCDKGFSFKFQNKEIFSHQYSEFYEKKLKDFKNKNINILEIGSHDGKGIASFYYYFPKAKIVGANINPFQLKYKSKRIREIYVDVASKEVLKNLSGYLTNKFDIIIDDASHNIRDIFITLSVFFKKLNNGGYYIIEDIDQHKVFTELNPNSTKFTPLEFLKKLSNNENAVSEYLSNDEIDYLKKNIKEYYFEKGAMVYENQNISDIVFLRK